MTQLKSYTPISAEYAQPYDKRIHVDTLSDLTSADTKFNYENMLVFVKSEKTLYFLKDGLNGSELSNWQKFELVDLTFAPYVSKAYTVGQPVTVGNSIFICIDDAIVTEDPLNFPNKWLQLGAGKFLAFNFENQTDFNIDHEIEAPSLKLWNSDGEEIDADVEFVSSTQFRIRANPAITGSGYVK